MMRLVLTAAAALILASCSESLAPAEPTTLELDAGDNQTVVAGQQVQPIPSFIVRDQRGELMGGVSFTIGVLAGGGMVTNTPNETSHSGPTAIGTWSLGSRVGLNQITVAVAGLPPLVITATAVAGTPAKLLAQTSTMLEGTVGQNISDTPIALVTDINENPVANSTVTITTSAGTAPANLTSDGAGIVSAGNWLLGTAKGEQTLTMSIGTAELVFTALAQAGAPALIRIVSGDAQATFAGRDVPSPIAVRLNDQYDNGVDGQQLSISVLAGSGNLAGSSVVTDDDGGATLPTWTLGKSADAQQLKVSAGAIATTVHASIETAFQIEVRYFGSGMTDEQRDLFDVAAMRISAVVVGDIGNVEAFGVNLEDLCGLTGLPQMNEIIDDVIIYASIRDIDGPGQTLARAGPCGFRNAAAGYLPAVGIMEFDLADLAWMAGEGSLEGVILHEMLHVMGISSLFWDVNGLLTGYNTSSVAYWGAGGRQGCLDDGGTIVCATSVPVENTGGQGTANSHWRESVFDSELMTGYANVGAMPLSAMTIGSLGDIGYTINQSAADDYRLPGAGIRATPPLRIDSNWEKGLPNFGFIFHQGGNIKRRLTPALSGLQP